MKGVMKKKTRGHRGQTFTGCCPTREFKKDFLTNTTRISYLLKLGTIKSGERETAQL